MPQPTDSARTIIQGSAHQLLSQIGRQVERLLLDRAASLAAMQPTGSGEIVVRVDHIRASAVECLPMEFRGRIGAFAHVEPGTGG